MFFTGYRLRKCSGKMSYDRASNNVLEGRGDSITVLSDWTLFSLLTHRPRPAGPQERYLWWCVWEKSGTDFLLESKCISWFLQGAFIYFPVTSRFEFLRDARSLSCVVGMHSVELSSQSSFLCGWFLYVVLSVVLKFHMQTASAGTSRGRINLTLETDVSSILGKYIAA